jgi:hypothetical protein
MRKETPLGIAALLWVAANPGFAADAPTAPPAAQTVHYDPATDRLSLDVHELPLTRVLERISRQSGVEILADPSVDHPVTASLQNQSLESALGGLTRGMNAVMIHDQREVPGQGKQPVLVRMELLPVGQSNKALSRPVRIPGGGAMPYARKADPGGSHAGRFLSGHRRTRLQQTDATRRQLRQERAAAMAAQTQATDTEREAQNRQPRLERLNRRLAQAQALAATDPEGSQQDIQDISQKMARIQKRQGKAAGSPNP